MRRLEELLSRFREEEELWIRARWLRRQAEAWRRRARFLYIAGLMVEGVRHPRFYRRLLTIPTLYFEVAARHPRVYILLRVLQGLFRAVSGRRLVVRVALRWMWRLIYRFRLRRDFERFALEVYPVIYKFYREVYYMLVDEIIKSNSRWVLPLVRVKFRQPFEYAEHEWLGRFWYRVPGGNKRQIIQRLRDAIYAYRTDKWYPYLTEIVEHVIAYLAYQLGIVDAPWKVGGVIIFPALTEIFAGEYTLSFYALIIPAKYARPDPYVGAASPRFLRQREYAWKDDFELLPIESPYTEDPRSIPTLFSEIGEAFFSLPWDFYYSNPTLVKSLISASIGLPENWIYAYFAAPKLVRLRMFVDEIEWVFRRKGAYYYVRTILHYLGIR